MAGVVGAAGVGGAWSAGSTGWRLSFALEPWRRTGEPVDPRELSIIRHVRSRRALERHMRRIRPYAVVRLRVRFDHEDETAATLLRRLSSRHRDPELAEWAQRMQVPVSVDVDPFGSFTLDRRIGSWESRQRWAGAEVDLVLDARAETELPRLAEIAAALWDDEERWDHRVRRRAIDELLEVANYWSERDEPVTPEEFARRMTVEAVTVDADGPFTFWFDDGDLFAGHTIHVSGTLAEGPTDAGFSG